MNFKCRLRLGWAFVLIVRTPDLRIRRFHIFLLYWTIFFSSDHCQLWISLWFRLKLLYPSTVHCWQPVWRGKYAKFLHFRFHQATTNRMIGPFSRSTVICYTYMYGAVSLHQMWPHVFTQLMMYATVRDVTGTRTFIEKLIAESKIPLLEFSSPLPPKNNPPPAYTLRNWLL